MKSFRSPFLHVLAVVAALAGASAVHAVALTANNLIGAVVPGTPSGDNFELARLQFFIDLYNTGTGVAPDGNSYLFLPGAALPATLPGPATLGTQIQTPNGLPVTVPNSYQYLMAKFGTDSVFYFLGGQTGAITDLYRPPGVSTAGLSHITLFNPSSIVVPPGVPDGGATLIMFGGVLAIFALVRFVRHKWFSA